jgi:hypothetical protein
MKLLQARDMLSDMHFDGLKIWKDGESGGPKAAVLPHAVTGERPATPDGTEAYFSLARQMKSSTLPEGHGLTQSQREYPGHMKLAESAVTFFKAEEAKPYMDFMQANHPDAISFPKTGNQDPPVPFGFNSQPGSGSSVFNIPQAWGNAHKHTHPDQARIAPDGRVDFPIAEGPSFDDFRTHLEGRMQGPAHSYLMEENPANSDRPHFSKYGYDTQAGKFFNERITGLPPLSDIAPGPIFHQIDPRPTHFTAFPEIPPSDAVRGAAQMLPPGGSALA